MDYMLELAARILTLASKHDPATATSAPPDWRDVDAARPMPAAQRAHLFVAAHYQKMLLQQSELQGQGEMKVFARLAGPAKGENLRGDTKSELLAAVLYDEPSIAVEIAQRLKIWPTFISELAERTEDLLEETKPASSHWWSEVRLMPEFVKGLFTRAHRLWAGAMRRLRPLMHGARPKTLYDAAGLSELGLEANGSQEPLVETLLRSPQLVQKVVTLTQCPVPFATALAFELDHLDDLHARREAETKVEYTPDPMEAARRAAAAEYARSSNDILTKLDGIATRIVEEAEKISDASPHPDRGSRHPGKIS